MPATGRPCQVRSWFPRNPQKSLSSLTITFTSSASLPSSTFILKSCHHGIFSLIEVAIWWLVSPITASLMAKQHISANDQTMASHSVPAQRIESKKETSFEYSAFHSKTPRLQQTGQRRRSKQAKLRAWYLISVGATARLIERKWSCGQMVYAVSLLRKKLWVRVPSGPCASRSSFGINFRKPGTDAAGLALH